MWVGCKGEHSIVQDHVQCLVRSAQLHGDRTGVKRWEEGEGGRR